jgi:hypothetical protein
MLRNWEGGISVSDSRLKTKATKILHRNNAQEILQALATLEEHRAEFATRWLWELIQNARDFPDDSRAMTIRISVSPKQITFAHNGRDFTEEEILSLIYHGSTKQSNLEQLGKFGTGFLSTHLLSKRVRVKGTLRDEDGVRRAFEFELDRSGDSAEQVGEAMQRSFRALEGSLARIGARPTDWTEYVYRTDGALDANELESDFPFKAIPYILVFDDNVDKVEVRLGDRRTTYERAGNEELAADGWLTVIEGIESVDRFLVYQENDIYAAIPVAERPDGSYELLPPGDVPRLFKFLPLVNSTNIGLPAIFHSRSFSTTENRDGLVFGASGPQGDVNKTLLTKAADCFLQLARNCAKEGFVKEGFHNSHLLLQIQALSDVPAWLEDRSWYEDWQRSIVRELATIPLIQLESGEPPASAIAPASEVDLPLGDESMTWRSVYQFGSDLDADRVPLEAIAEDCSVVADEWTSLLGEDDPLIQSCVLTPVRLIERARDTGSLENLGAALELEPAETVEWLNGLISSVPEPQRPMCLDGLIPDQTLQGNLRSSAELSRDTDIDDDLKNVLETLGDPIRERLAHADIAGTETMVKRAQLREPLVSNAKDLLKKRASATPDDPKFRAACLTMFHWLAGEGLWSDLKDAIPVYTLDSDETEIVSQTSARGPALLAPRELWPEKARGYWDAFPRGSILSDDYASLLDSSSWSEVAANGIVMTELVWSEEDELEDLEKYTRDLELEGDDHSAAAPMNVGKLAFVGSSELYEALRSSRERAARFFQFILDYVVNADDTWKQRIQIHCECGKDHEIIPCEWLAWIRDREWVPRPKGHERLTDTSLARLTRHDTRLADTVTREEHADFLNLVGINVLEQALLATSPSQSSELRRRFAQLARLAVQHPEAVTRLMQDIEAHHEADKRWRENQKLGKMIEELVRAQLRSRLLRRIRLKTQFKGYDLRAYVDDPSYADVGSIEVKQSETLLAKIEIKATRGKAVSLSNLQGEEASNDHARYWLCVVPLDPGEDIDQLTPERVEELARFVSGIGSRLASALEDIQDAVESADASGFDLEHVDDIRYGVRSQMWESEAIPLKGFADLLSKQVSASRR